MGKQNKHAFFNEKAQFFGLPSSFQALLARESLRETKPGLTSVFFARKESLEPPKNELKERVSIETLLYLRNTILVISTTFSPSIHTRNIPSSLCPSGCFGEPAKHVFWISMNAVIACIALSPFLILSKYAQASCSFYQLMLVRPVGKILLSISLVYMIVWRTLNWLWRTLWIDMKSLQVLGTILAPYFLQDSPGNLWTVPNYYCSTAIDSISISLGHQDFIFFLHSLQMKRHKNEMNGCVSMSRTHLRSQNVNRIYNDLATESWPL